MEKIFCDKCGKQMSHNTIYYEYKYNKEELAAQDTIYPMLSKREYKDVCPDCTLKFRELVDDFFWTDTNKKAAKKERL